MIGNSSANIIHTLNIEVGCANPYTIGPRTDIVKVVSNPKAVEIVERATGVKLREVAGSYIVFQPLTPFEQIWQECIMPVIKVDEEISKKMQEEIYKEWKNL